MSAVSATAPRLSVIVNFFNMRREAARTLYTLSTAYQRGVSNEDFEVIVVDNGSSVPLTTAEVEAHGANFRLLRIEGPAPSPCAAINRAVAIAAGANVMICIDGARMVSPGVLGYALSALGLHSHPFVYTLGMHLGHRPQNELIDDGYCQLVEDELLATVDWRSDGYRLFQISSIAYSSRNGFFSRLSESNCFALRRSDYLALGGLDERFTSAGGGLANLDFFNRANEQERLRPIMLLGEATFHQFHGGVATNVRRADHPWDQMAAEYAEIRRKPFATVWRAPEYLGWISDRYHKGLLSL